MTKYAPDLLEVARLPMIWGAQPDILAGLVGHRDIKDDPTILWTVDDNGWIYEARITTPTQPSITVTRCWRATPSPKKSSHAIRPMCMHIRS